jgi:hypothetical protein
VVYLRALFLGFLKIFLAVFDFSKTAVVEREGAALAFSFTKGVWIRPVRKGAFYGCFAGFQRHPFCQ